MFWGKKVWSNLLSNLKQPLRKKKNNNKNKNCVSSIYYKMPWNSHAETSNRSFLKKGQRLRNFASSKTPWGQRRGVHMQTSFRLALGNLQRFLLTRRVFVFFIFQIYKRNIKDFFGLENRRNRGCRKYSLFSHWRMLRAFKKFLLSLYFAFITLRVFVECWQKSCTVNLISLISVIFLKILVVI